MKGVTMVVLALIFGVIISAGIASSADYNYQINVPIEFVKPCWNNGTYCSASATCNITSLYPNGTIYVNNGIMTNNIYTHNFTIPASATRGEYEVQMSCCDGGQCGNEDYIYELSPTGLIVTGATAVVNIGLLIMLIIFMVVSITMFVKFDNLLARVGMFGLSYLLLIAITFISWNMAIDFALSLPFLVSMFKILFFVLIIGFFPLIIGSFVWYFIMLFKIKEIERLMTKGFSFDEAERRVGRRR